MALETQRLWLTFEDKTLGQPLLYQMTKQFDLPFNIRNASVTPSVGIIAIEIEGEREVIKKAVAWLESSGVQVEPVEINTIEG
ncbi:MAG TPA: NIL domain-containing protein [Candidatus Methylacidiphilales bacterium]|jgi:ABC-type methionine transport system ATPase subunit|nr:NIL domain-containing protein [Candidatus Methylacidiphilales bacterium]